MEKAYNVSSPPAFCVGANEKGTSSTYVTQPLSHGTAEAAACISKHVSRDATGCSDSRESGEAGEDIGRSTVLVTDSPSGDTVSNCVIPEPGCDSATNGFTVSTMVGAKAGNSSAVAAVNREEMDGNALQRISLAEKNKESSAEEVDACHPPLNFVTAAETVESLTHSCNGQLELSCTAASRTVPEGLSNWDTDSVIQSTLSSDAVIRRPVNWSMTPDKEAKMANGGLFIGHSSAKLHTETVVTIILDGAATCLSNTQCEKPSIAMSAREGHHKSCNIRVEPPGAQPRTQANVAGDLSGGATSNLTSQGLPSSPAPTKDPCRVSAKPDTIQGEESSASGHLGDDLSSRPHPQALRTRTVPNSVSYDSTILSPGDEDGETFAELGAQGHSDRRFMDVSLSSRNTFESSRRQSAPGDIPEGLSVVSADPSELALQSKRPGIAEYFGRSLFPKKQREPKGPSQNVPGWKLFGKVPARESAPKDSRTIQQESTPDGLASVSTPNLLSAGEFEARVGKAGPGGTSAGTSPTQPQQGRRKNLEFEPLSTTALILEDRPANLPAKSVEEAQRHRQEYDEMVAEAKKRELKEAQRKRKEMKERFKQEESIANAMVVWNNDILPNWENTRNTRRVRELWWQGLPPNVRGKVWSLAIGNELNITPELYEIFLSRAKERWRSFSETGSETEADDGASLADRESSLDLIKLDISRTFPPLFIFQKGGPYHDLLHSVLGAYTCYRPDVGYVQGMSFIAAVLILNLEEADAFIAFANLLNKPCQLAFFRVDHDLMLKYFAAFEVFFEENLPRLFNHFQSSNLTPDLYLIDWIFTLYSKSLPLDVACRVWDVFCRDGEEFLFRTGLGILRLYEDVLLQLDFIRSAQFLTRLPEDIGSDRLFACIAAAPMLNGNRKWSQVFHALIKDNKDMDRNCNPALKSL
ncbi:TBC1 domain family member 12 isoform X1 [Oncorhynchus nerka]|uniref:TBC1 domain family member 12 isoform X1 n=1 Tax=Oncorhynchus nerka TaxID=8023 RepID=UPI0011329E67|nr:TBC1 domain family member 12-like isoform X1 [Oncorhynchus nerka]